MRKNYKIIIVVVLVVIALLLVVLNENKGVDYTGIAIMSDKTWSESSIFTNPEYQDMQKQEMKDEYNAFDHSYTLDDPYIKVNPYSINPLSAYIAFDSEKPVKYSYIVHSDDGENDFEYANDKYSKNVVIPVLGLFENSNNQVTINIEDKDGNIKSNDVNIITKEVSYNPVSVSKQGELSDNMANGWFFDPFYNGFDTDGNIRYNLNVGVEDNSMKFTDNSFFVKVDNYQTIYEINIMGEIINTYKTPSGEYNFHHDIVKTDDGTVYALASYNVDLPDIPHAESLIFKYNPGSQYPDKIIDIYDLFDENLVSSYGTPNQNDPIHINSIEYIKESNELIISSQSQSFIAAINADSGNLNWVIQDDGSNIENKDAALTIANEDEFEKTSGQHTALRTYNSKYQEYMDKGDIVLSVFNNNNCKDDAGNLVWKKYSDEVDQSVCTYDESDVLIYAVDEKNKTVTQIDNFTVDSEYAPIMSSVFDADEDTYIIHFNRVGKPKSYLIDNQGNVLIKFTVNGYEGNGYYRTNFKSQSEIQALISSI